MSERGVFVVLEGADGSGKTIQTMKLTERLRNEGVEVRVTREHWPEDVLGEAIHRVVELKLAKLDSTALQLAFIGNRVNHTTQMVKPWLETGAMVVSDRYLESTIAYATDEDRQMLIRLTEMLQQRGKILRPNLSILVDVPVEEIMTRLEMRSTGVDGGEKKHRQSIFEKRPKLEKVRTNYLQRFNLGEDTMIVVDGVGTVEEVNDRIYDQIRRRKLIR